MANSKDRVEAEYEAIENSLFSILKGLFEKKYI